MTFPFSVVAGDLEYVGVRTRAGEVPEQQWGVFDADRLPFADQQFDAVFAGEIIEHTPDAAATLAEWRRVAQTGRRRHHHDAQPGAVAGSGRPP